MKKTIEATYYSQSKKWPRRLPKIRLIGKKVIRIMKNYFNNNSEFNLNIILSDKKKIKELNKKYKKKYKDTDVLTFVSQISNKYVGKILYCDIFFSIETIESFIKNKNISLYDHFTHLLVHSLLHINGYKHKNLNEFKKMKKQEIKILKQLSIEDPYKIDV
ncbi:MAG: rRNA maturation RNase YbeY [Pelagibacteraceae bacterium TMED237]|nr:MAG: rRNA maturation RNase YbeY [Pelagibacteraceae bacterium TMED237]|tara:strand:- start:387 stop:869 length:483 start_codon:yes stop_codon:yes gene_type:complete